MTAYAQNPSVELVTLVGGVPKTTSLIVAQKFRKRHSDVMRALSKLECSDDFRERNFAFTFRNIPGPKNSTRQERIVEMTKDGFIFLVMGFTGSEAARTKEAYIGEFNRMEAVLREPVPPAPSMAPPPAAASPLTDEENDRLMEVPLAARVLYLQALRPAMDPRTGLVGHRPGYRITLKTLAARLAVEPHQGLQETGIPSRFAVRRALVWLIKLGLIERRTDDTRMVLFLPLAWAALTTAPALPASPPPISDRIFMDTNYAIKAVDAANQFIWACEDAAQNGGPLPKLDSATRARIAEGLCRHALHGRQYVVSFDMPFSIKPLPKNIHEAEGPELLRAVLEGIARLDQNHAADLLNALAARLRGN